MTNKFVLMSIVTAPDTLLVALFVQYKQNAGAKPL